MITKHTIYILRIIVLSMLLIITCVVLLLLRQGGPYPDQNHQPFVLLWYASFLPYIVASLLICTTRPAPGRWRRVELGLILGGALFLRVMVLPLEPNLSHDSWRYIWDAQVTLHGYSPYAYAPNDPALAWLRDSIYESSRYRNVPTIYPPAAQAIYILSYIIVPDSLFTLKTIFIVIDILACILLMYLLHQRGLDPARSVIYAWSPLPIIEFAIQGHVDILVVGFTLLALVTASRPEAPMRALTGFWLGLATITKFYPLLFIVALARRRDWWLIATCGITIVLGYMPYLILAHGDVLGFLATYASERGGNGGLLILALKWLGSTIPAINPVLAATEHLLFAGIIGGSIILVRVLLQQRKITTEAALLLLIGAVFLISPHIFPWYTTILLPWVALLIRPIWNRNTGLSIHGLIVVAAWFATCLTPISYLFVGLNHTPYYWLVYAPLWLVAGLCFLTSIRRSDTINIWSLFSAKTWVRQRDRKRHKKTGAGLSTFSQLSRHKDENS